VTQLVIVDYGAGNISSVRNAFRHLGFEPLVSHDPNQISNADSIVLPGVGSFGAAMSFLRTTDADAAVAQFATTGKPLLGICLGMQLLFDRSTEFGETPGLGLIRGEVEELQKIEQPSEDWKVPNVGWRGLKSNCDKPDHLLLGLPSDAEFYFTHSFSATRVEDGDVLATTRWSNADLVAVVRKDNLWGTQFHPEKSGLHGLQLLKNFLSA